LVKKSLLLLVLLPTCLLAQRPKSQLLIEQAFGFYTKNNYPAALVTFEKAIVQARAEKDTMQILVSYSNIYGVYNTQGQQHKFLKYAQKLQPYLVYNNPLSINIHSVMAGAYIRNAQLAQAQHELQLASNLAKKITKKDDNYYYELGLLHNIKASLSELYADYPATITWHQKALEYYQAIKTKYEFTQLEIYNEQAQIAKIHQLTGNYDQAKKYLQLSKSLIKLSNFDKTISYYLQLAELYRKPALNKPDSALHYTNLCLKLYQKYKLQNLSGRAYYTMAMVFFENNQLAEAEAYFTKSLNIRLLQSGRTAAQCYQSLGQVAAAKGNAGQALKYYQQAMVLLCQKFSPKQPLANPQINQILYIKEALELLKLKATLLYQQNQLQATLHTCTLADELLSQMRNSYSMQASKLYVVEQAQNIYAICLDAAYRMYLQKPNRKNLDVAFVFTEKNRSIVLSESLKLQNISQYPGVSSQTIQQLQTIQKNIAIAENQLKLQPDTKHNSHSRWAAQLLQNTEALELLKKQIKRKYPNFYSYQFVHNPLSINTIQAKLQANEAYYSFASGQQHIYRFQITEGTFALKKLTTIASIQQQAAQYRLAIQNMANATVFAPIAHGLYLSLFASCDLTKHQNIHIVPNATLLAVPFEALMPAASNSTKQAGSYLIEAVAISYALSVSASIAQAQQKSFSTTYTAMVPNYNAAMALPHNQKVVQYLAAKFPSKIYQNSMANKPNFKTLAPSQVLQLATHGSANMQQPERSYLLMGSDTLLAPEIYQCSLPTQLAVLDACETGLGQIIAGEGSLNLARAFMYAGAGSVAMSLWQQNSSPETTTITQNFIENHLNGQPAAAALQQAKINYLELHRTDALLGHPYYWASLVLVGGGVATSTGVHWGYWLVAGLALLAGLGYYFYQKKPKTVKP
jgi:CHAT domain-containing protein/tetratricopeptide (TPR) repeat protein